MLFSLGLKLLSLICLFSGYYTALAKQAFEPWSYKLDVAKCEMRNRAEGSLVEAHIHYADINPNASKALLMVHGWPSLWSSWSNQILELEKDYHLIIPNLRGFGPSEHPNDVESSGTMGDLVGDLMCVLNNVHVKTAVCVGHDWGSQICWEAARMRPDVIEGVAASVFAYLPPTLKELPISQLLQLLPRLAYQLVLEKAVTAGKELDLDIRRTLRAVFRNIQSPPPPGFLTSTERMLEGWDEYEEIPPIPFFSKEEEDYWVEQHSIQGFKNTLYFYAKTSRKLSAEEAIAQGNTTIPQPGLIIFPTKDPVADWQEVAEYLQSYKNTPNLRIETLPTAHWPQLEAPEEFNNILRNYLSSLPDVYHWDPDSDDPPRKSLIIRDEL